MPDFVIGREPALESRVVFVGEAVLALPIGFLSEIVVGCVTDFLSEVGRLETVEAAIDSLLGAPSTGFCFFSSPDVSAFVFSSTELTDARGLWALAALVELAIGFLSVELVSGLAGGLLRVVPAVVLAAAVNGVFKPEDVEDFGFTVELGMVRFGIEPAFDFGGVPLASTVCCSMVSIGSSMVNQECEGSRWDTGLSQCQKILVFGQLLIYTQKMQWQWQSCTWIGWVLVLLLAFPIASEQFGQSEKR
jgi:hypothetical protein